MACLKDICLYNIALFISNGLFCYFTCSAEVDKEYHPPPPEVDYTSTMKKDYSRGIISLLCCAYLFTVAICHHMPLLPYNDSTVNSLESVHPQKYEELAALMSYLLYR